MVRQHLLFPAAPMCKTFVTFHVLRMYANVCILLAMQSTTSSRSPAEAQISLEKPAWLAAWKSQDETLAVLRLLRPRLHKTTLGRMRRQGKIEATKFAGEWYYKPETALPPVGK